jgi:hypothetical protein
MNHQRRYHIICDACCNFTDKQLANMPAGSFVTHFGKQVHWDGAKDEDAVLLIMGEGPATATSVPEEK